MVLWRLLPPFRGSVGMIPAPGSVSAPERRIGALTEGRVGALAKRRIGALRGLACAAALALLAGCVTTSERGESVASGHVLSVGFENLSQRYIEPVRPEKLALVGIGGLTDFAPGLGIARRDGAVQLTLGGAVIGEHAAPGDDDIYGWSWLAAAALEDARRAVPEVQNADIEDVYAAVFKGALSGFDRYSRYATPDTTRRSRASRDGFGGLGITIDQDDGVTVVTRVHDGTPAAASGMKVDDRITHVDDKPIYGLSLAEVVALLRGPVDERVTLTVTRGEAAKPQKVTMARAHIVVPTVHVRRDGGILDIKLSGFNQGTATALRRALVKAEREMGDGLKGVILDLRGNPGGLLGQAVSVADLFITSGRIISTKGRHPESDQIFDATPGALASGKPLAVLVNGRSASAAEIVAVALRDSGRAVIIGSTSYGKGTVQTIVPMPNGAELILTWARIRAPSGQTLDHQGIVPAFCTAGDEKRVSALLKAISAAERGVGKLRADQLVPQKGRPHFTKAGHSACPPSPAQGAADMQAARLLLGNAALYAQALSGRGAIARRQDGGAAPGL
jgi:carboxyl-terminal processing protease